MRRIKATLFAVVAIAIVISTIIQVQNMGAPWFFAAFGVFMIIVIVISVIRAWLRP
ncbi:MAG: hypothetical protein JSW14_03870 [Candidatus Bathyarchaeum sp.]|nr:MAG: hypothetical protein JSW14_03870 [Candidatus Bathyarchaeum sp.]